MLRGLTEAYVAAFSSKDLAALEIMLHENFVLEDPIVKRLIGKKSALLAMEKIFEGSNSLNFRAINIFVDGLTTLIEFQLELDEVTLKGVDVISWKDGRMQELRAYLDVPKGQ